MILYKKYQQGGITSLYDYSKSIAPHFDQSEYWEKRSTPSPSQIELLRRKKIMDKFRAELAARELREEETEEEKETRQMTNLFFKMYKKQKGGKIKDSRFDAVKGLVNQGITNPRMILNYLNVTEDGEKVGDFTLDEVKGIVSELLNNKNKNKKYQTGGEVSNYNDQLYSLGEQYNFADLDTAVYNIAANKEQPAWLQQELNDSGIDVNSPQFQNLITNSPFYFPKKEEKPKTIVSTPPKPIKPYIKKILNNYGPATLFHVDSRGRTTAITQGLLDTKYADLKDTIKIINYKR